MHKLIITLKQHTPIIHFQHDQDGATLRASEVKPKLDRYILTKLGENPDQKEIKSIKEKWEKKKENKGKNFYNFFSNLTTYEKGILIAKYRDWLIGEGEHPALNYKMKISPGVDMEELQTYEMNVPEKRRNRNTNQDEIRRKYSRKYGRQIPLLTSYPLFFGNMDIDYESDNAEIKRLAFASYVYMDLIFLGRNERTPLPDIFTKESICEFLLKTNFGSRQSKGFGSFYVDEEDEDWYIEPSTVYSFNINVEDDDIEDEFNTLFNNIDLFYKTLRGGVNLKDWGGNTIFYFKSLAFMYAKDVLIAHWDKRAVKEQFYNYRRFDRDGVEIDSLPKQVDEHGEDCELLTIHFDQSYDIRDLLGFSTDEQWMSFKDSIEKKCAIVTGGRPRFPNRNEALPVERMQSPLLFKPIYNEDDDSYTIFLVFKDDKVGMDSFKRQQKICFYSKNEKDTNGRPKRFMLDIPNVFSLQGYFDYIFNILRFDISTHVETQYHHSKEYQILENIYSQLKTKSK
jgi:hypothetical protein